MPRAHPPLCSLSMAFITVLVAGGCNTRRAEPAAPKAAGAPVNRPAAAASRVELLAAPSGGEVAPWVKRQLGELRARGRTGLVYEGAVWCDPCQRFHEAARSGKLDGLLGSVTFLEFDADRDAERLAMAGYLSNLIPLFAAPDPEGRASGKQIEGGVKGDGSVDELVLRLRGLVAAQP